VQLSSTYQVVRRILGAIKASAVTLPALQWHSMPANTPLHLLCSAHDPPASKRAHSFLCKVTHVM
jgi:hypothetical protein